MSRFNVWNSFIFQLSSLQKELEHRSFSHENHISDLCSMQWMTLNNLRSLSQQAQFLENEANRVLGSFERTQRN